MPKSRQPPTSWLMSINSDQVLAPYSLIQTLPPLSQTYILPLSSNLMPTHSVQLAPAGPLMIVSLKPAGSVAPRAGRKPSTTSTSANNTPVLNKVASGNQTLFTPACLDRAVPLEWRSIRFIGKLPFCSAGVAQPEPDFFFEKVNTVFAPTPCPSPTASWGCSQRVSPIHS